MLEEKDLVFLNKISYLMMNLGKQYNATSEIRFGWAFMSGEFYIDDPKKGVGYLTFSNLENAVEILEQYPDIEFEG